MDQSVNPTGRDIFRGIPNTLTTNGLRPIIRIAELIIQIARMAINQAPASSLNLTIQKRRGAKPDAIR